jgi:Protein of unknown function (DUF3887)
MTDPGTTAACEACGRPLAVNTGRGRPKRFCNATCRSAARRLRTRTETGAGSPVKMTLTSASRQDYVDDVIAAEGPAQQTASRLTSVTGQLAAALAQTGAGSSLAAMRSARDLTALANAALQEAVDRARAAGHSWKEIGDVLETSRQAAFQRFGRPVDPRTGEPMSRSVLPGAADRAVEIFADIAAGRWEAARADFAPKMLEAVSATLLADGWAQMAGLFGRYESMGEPFTHPLGEHTVADIPLHFEAGEATGHVTFDGEGKVAGLFIRPAAEQ